MKAKNFLVYQGAVENLSLKTRKELTSLFEEVSESIALKVAYEKCKAELAAAEADLALSTQKKRSVAAGVAEARMEQDELETYQEQCEQLVKLETRLNLFKLYQCEHKIDSSKEEAEKLKERVDQNVQSKALENNYLLEKGRQRVNVNKSLAKY